MTIIAGSLNDQQTQQEQQNAQAIADAAQAGAIRSNQFVFFAAFDGTNNDRNDVPLSGNPQDTNVAQLYYQTQVAAASNKNLGVGYYPGPGTEGSLPGSAALPTQQVIDTAQLAYRDFAQQASDWLKNNPGGDVTTAIASFSRGDASAAIFSQLLYEKGLVDPDNASQT